MKNIYLHRIWVLISFLILTLSQAWADPTKCTATTDLTAGDVYYISGADTYSSTATVMAKSTGGNNFPASTFGGSPVELTLGGNATDGWTFSYKDGSTTYYLDPTSTTSSNYLKRNTSLTDYGKFTISFSSGAAVITSKGKSSRNIIRMNGSIYSCYSSGQSAVYLYKKGASYTITAASNNTSYGTVSLTGSVITATPASGYRVSTSTPYSVSPSSSATVSQDGNEFTVTASANTTVTINFEAIPTHTISFDTNGLNSISSVTVAEGATHTITETPTGLSSSCEYPTFVGWTTESSTYVHGTSTLYTVGGSIAMSTSNIALHAVYSKTTGGGSEPTAYSAGDEGDFVIASYNTSDSKWYALPTSPTVSSGKIAGVEITVNTTSGSVNYVTTTNASGYTWTIADATNGQTISDGTSYIYHSNGGSSGTNLTYGSSTSYTWKIESETNGLTFKGMSGSTTNSRGMLMSGTTFGGYSLSNEDATGYYRIQVLPIGSTGTTTYSLDAGCCSPLGQINGPINLTRKKASIFNKNNTEYYAFTNE